jgi:hypothetical protein
MIYSGFGQLRVFGQGAARRGQVVDLGAKPRTASNAPDHQPDPPHGRRPGEIIGVKIGCVEVIDGQHNFSPQPQGRPTASTLPVTADTADVIAAWQRHRTQLPMAPTTRPSERFPSPLLRSRQCAPARPAVGAPRSGPTPRQGRRPMMTWLTSDYGSMVRVSRAALLATSDITPRGLAPRSTIWHTVTARE